jgi:hypothetical protein
VFQSRAKVYMDLVLGLVGKEDEKVEDPKKKKKFYPLE